VSLERGFRRITLLVSVGILVIGLSFTLVLLGGWWWALHLDRQREETLISEGCPADGEKTLTVTVQSVGPGRWRVNTPETGSHVVKATRDLGHDELVYLATAPSVIEEHRLGRSHPATNVEVVACSLESHRISIANEQALGNRVISWWMERPGVVYAMLPIVTFGPNGGWTLLAAMLFAALALTVFLASIPWGLFHLARWIARGFGG
jgi:hypothetical protein